MLALVSSLHSTRGAVHVPLADTAAVYESCHSRWVHVLHLKYMLVTVCHVYCKRVHRTSCCVCASMLSYAQHLWLSKAYIVYVTCAINVTLAVLRKAISSHACTLTKHSHAYCQLLCCLLRCTFINRNGERGSLTPGADPPVPQEEKSSFRKFMTRFKDSPESIARAAGTAANTGANSSSGTASGSSAAANARCTQGGAAGAGGITPEILFDRSVCRVQLFEVVK
jgi:hypothetical protein